MKIILQRVKEASVEVEGSEVESIGRGVCLLVGVEKEDTEEEIQFLVRKVADLRIFPDNEGKMNLSLEEIKGEVLAVSQFTLAASIRKGRRPSFDKAEEPGKASRLFDYFVELMRQRGISVKTGIFQAMMNVRLVNEGPVTFILDSRDLYKSRRSA